MKRGWLRAPVMLKSPSNPGGTRRAQATEYFDRRHRADQHKLRRAPFAVPRHVARRLAAARGMSHMDDVTQIERGHDRCDVGRVGVHVMALRSLAGTAVAAAIMRDHAIALVEEEEHLRVPVVGAERPAMMENDRLARAVLCAPILVEDFRAVFGFDRGHRPISRVT